MSQPTPTLLLAVRESGLQTTYARHQTVVGDCPLQPGMRRGNRGIRRGGYDLSGVSINSPGCVKNVLLRNFGTLVRPVPLGVALRLIEPYPIENHRSLSGLNRSREILFPRTTQTRYLRRR